MFMPSDKRLRATRPLAVVAPASASSPALSLSCEGGVQEHTPRALGPSTLPRSTLLTTGGQNQLPPRSQLLPHPTGPARTLPAGSWLRKGTEEDLEQQKEDCEERRASWTP